MCNDKVLNYSLERFIPSFGKVHKLGCTEILPSKIEGEMAVRCVGRFEKVRFSSKEHGRRGRLGRY